MKRRLYLIIERATCTCWITGRNWTFRVPLWPGRIADDDSWTPGAPNHSLGSVAYTLETRILCSRFMGWLWPTGGGENLVQAPSDYKPGGDPRDWGKGKETP